MFRDFPTFSRICIFFLLTLSTLLCSNLSPLSASSLLCFSSVHIVRSLTSKLPLGFTKTSPVPSVIYKKRRCSKQTPQSSDPGLNACNTIALASPCADPTDNARSARSRRVYEAAIALAFRPSPLQVLRT